MVFSVPVLNDGPVCVSTGRIGSYTCWSSSFENKIGLPDKNTETSNIFSDFDKHLRKYDHFVLDIVDLQLG